MPATGALVAQCRKAAAELGFSVPCPSLVQGVEGEVVLCSDGCAGVAGGDETLHRLFSYDIAEFDGGNQVGPVRHARFEARRVRDAPPVACYGGQETGRIDADRVSVLDCPDRSDESSANTRHGEGANAGHSLGYWDVDGVRFVVSVHGNSPPARSLLEELIAAVELVGP